MSLAEDPGPALRRTALFRELPAEALALLLARTEVVHAPARTWLFRAGDEPDALYVVQTGRLEVVDERPSTPVTLRVLTRDAVVGELALLTDSPRSASVRAVRDSRLLRISRDQILALLAESRPFAVGLTRMLGQLLQGARAPSTAPAEARVLTLIRLDPGVPFASVEAGFESVLAGYGRLSVLRAGDFDLGAAGWEATAAEALDRCEHLSDRVLLVADAVDSPWGAFCLRQADRVLAVAAADGEPGGEELRGCDLLLWPGRSRSAVARWLVALEPRAHHRLQPEPGLAASVARAARRVAGRSVGLVLSGGGARGLAHIGVLEVLRDAGVHVDRVGGCSIGAFVGACAALERSPAEIEALCHRELVVGKPFRDYVVPRHALLRGRRWAELLARTFGDHVVEETPLPFFCVSADLVAAETVVHRTGPLWQMVGASMSLPGLVPPLALDGRLLVDGGVLNNFPVDVMAAGGEGPVIAVDAMGRMHGDRPQGAGLPQPSILDVLTRVTALGSWDRALANRALAEVIVEPDLRAFGMFDFARLGAIVEAGRSAARAALADSGWRG